MKTVSNLTKDTGKALLECKSLCVSSPASWYSGSWTLNVPGPPGMLNVTSSWRGGSHAWTQLAPLVRDIGVVLTTMVQFNCDSQRPVGWTDTVLEHTD